MIDYNTLNEGTLARLYQGARERIKQLEDLVAEEQETIKEVGSILQQRLTDRGVNAIATDWGTIHTTTRTTARVMDPQVLQDFVIKGNNPGCIDWKANASWCRSYSEDTKQPVPGVELSTLRQLRITAPKPKKD